MNFSILDYNFLEFVLKEPVNEKERILIYDIVNDLLNGKSSEISSVSSMALRSRLFSRRQILQELVNHPSLVGFLRSEEASVLIWDWAIGSGNKEVLDRLTFHSAVEEFKSLATRALLPTRARAIAEKYIDSNANCILTLSSASRSEVMTLIEEDKITRALFAPAQRDVILILNQEFESTFLPSKYFRHLQAELESVNNRIDLLYSNDHVEDVTLMTDDDGNDSTMEASTNSSSHLERLSILWK